MSDVLSALGVVPRGGNYENVRAHMARLGLTGPVRRGRRLSSITPAELAEAVRGCPSVTQAARALGVTNPGRLATLIETLGVDASHFRGQGWRRGSTTPVVPATPLTDVLVKGRLYSTYDLKGG
jgi:hypothetical protein